MERLPNETLKNAIGVYKTAVEACKNIDVEDYNPTLDKVTIKFLEELQQYRATGLTPTMIEDLKKGINNAHKAALENAHLLDEYKVLEEQGLLLRLPCKVGDTVCYIKGGYYKKPQYCEVKPIEVTEISLKNNRSGKSLDWAIIANGTRYKISSIGKTVFLTRKEAEKALEKLKGEEHG